MLTTVRCKPGTAAAMRGVWPGRLANVLTMPGVSSRGGSPVAKRAGPQPCP